MQEDNKVLNEYQEDMKFVKVINNDLFFDFSHYLEIDPNIIDIKYFSFCNIKNRSVLNHIFSLAQQLNELFSIMQDKLDKEFYENYFSLFIIAKTEGVKITLAKKIIDSVIDRLIEPINEIANKQTNAIMPPNKDINKLLSNDSKKELYFTKEQLLKIVKIIILSKIIYLPTSNIIGKNEAEKQIKKYIQEKVLLTEFTDKDKEINILNKLQKLCQSRLLSTIYSDKRFWTLGEIHGFTPLTYSNVLFKKIITNIIVVMDYDKNPINFLDVYIRNNIKWLFKRKFNIVYNVINTVKEENDFDLIAELINSKLAIKNISTNIIIKEKILNFIKTNMKYYRKETYIKELYTLLDKRFRRNYIFKYITIPYIAKLLNIDSGILLTVNRKLFIFITIITYIKLLENNFVILASLLLSNTDEHVINQKNSPENYKKIKQIENDEDINKVIKTKYKIFDNKENVKKEILKVIGTIYYNKFISIIDNQELKIDIELLKSEYIRFIETML